MPFASQPPAEQVTARDKRRILAAIAAVLLVIAAIAVWAWVQPGGYGSSRDGCVSVTMPGSTGGSVIHQCGSEARILCKHAYAGTDKASILTRPQCRLAGISPARAASASS